MDRISIRIKKVKYQYETKIGPIIRAATFTRVNDTVSCFAINIYKIGLLFTRTLACDQRHGLLIAFPNEKWSLKQLYVTS